MTIPSSAAGDSDAALAAPELALVVALIGAERDAERGIHLPNRAARMQAAGGQRHVVHLRPELFEFFFDLRGVARTGRVTGGVCARIQRRCRDVVGGRQLRLAQCDGHLDLFIRAGRADSLSSARQPIRPVQFYTSSGTIVSPVHGSQVIAQLPMLVD